MKNIEKLKEEILSQCKNGEAPWWHIEDMPKEIKDDKEIALIFVKERWSAFEHFSYRLRNDPDVAKLAISVPLDGGEMIPESYPIVFAGPDICSNKELMKIAVSANACALEYASEELKADIDVIDSNKPYYDAYFEYWDSSIRYASPILLDNEEFIRERLVPGFAFASERLRSQPDIALCAIKADATMFRYIGKELLSNKEFMHQIVLIAERIFSDILLNGIYWDEVEICLNRGTLQEKYDYCFWQPEDDRYPLYRVKSPLFEDETFINEHEQYLCFMTMYPFKKDVLNNPNVGPLIQKRKDELVDMLITRLKYHL